MNEIFGAMLFTIARQESRVSGQLGKFRAGGLSQGGQDEG
jgi:hypothetical protein